MNSKSNAQAMETEKISRLLARLAIPAVVAQIINLLYNIVDRIYANSYADQCLRYAGRIRRCTACSDFYGKER